MIHRCHTTFAPRFLCQPKGFEKDEMWYTLILNFPALGRISKQANKQINKVTESSAASQEIPCILWNKFITVFKTACHLSSFSVRSTLFAKPPHHNPISWRSILTMSYPRFSKWSLSLRFPHQNPVCTSPHPTCAICHTLRIYLDFTPWVIKAILNST